MIRNLKIITGLVLFVFVGVHLSNLALGVFSLKVADEVRPWLMAPFTNTVGGMILILSMLLHMLLGLHSLYHRNTLRMSRYDTVQFVTAFLIPPLLIPHVWGLIALKQLLDLSPSYLDIFRVFWVHSPLDGLRQVLLVVVVWIHGCIGLFTWLQLKSWWTHIRAFAYPLAVAVPVVALLGFVAGGNHILASAERTQSESDPYAYDTSVDNSDRYAPSPSYATSTNPPLDRYGERLESVEAQDVLAFITQVKWQMIYAYLVLLLGVLLARSFRLRGRKDKIQVRYADGRVIKGNVGPTLLELANISDIPHANLCRGRGRCGTCRVEILHSDQELPPPTKLELETLNREGSDQNVRLACQLSPGPGVISVKRLLPPNVQRAYLQQQQDATAPSDGLDTTTSQPETAP